MQFKEPMLAQSFDVEKHNPFPCEAEPKLNGVRITSLVENNEVTFYTRKGKMLLFPHLVEPLLQVANGESLVFDGELLGQTLSHVMNQLFRKYNRDLTGINYHLFDGMTEEQWNTEITPSLLERKSELKKRCNRSSTPSIQYVELFDCENYRVAQKLQKRFLKQYGKRCDGLILKTNTPYEWKKSNNWLKFKPFETYDVPIVGLIEGTGQYEDHLGAFVVELNKVQFKVGTGLTRIQRKEYWLNRYKLLGKIVEIKCAEVTKAGALSHPVFLNWREDKD